MGSTTRFLLVLLTAFTLTACGGGGGPGTAEITDANAKDVAVAGAEATKAATSSEEVPLSFKSGATAGYPANALDVFALGKQIATNRYATENLDYLCDAGGSLTVEVPDTATQSSYTATATYSDCTISGYGGADTTINGTISIRGNSTSFTITANLTVTTGADTETYSYSGTCSTSGSEDSCSYSASFTGDDGRSYSMSGVTVSGDDISGYTVSGRVTDPDYGVVTIATTAPVKFECTNGNPSEGVITVTGSATVTVTFIDCNSFSVTFDGTTTTYDWATI